ncbi:MAG: hypothetical protein AB7E32_12305 [Desulfovibrio sp.]
MRARTVSRLLSLGLHLAALGLALLLAPPDALRHVLGVELTDEELSGMLPPEYAAPLETPVYIPISPNKVLVTYGGRNATEEELFREFAEAGGLVGGIDQTSYGPKVRFGTTLFDNYHSYYVSGLTGHFRTDEDLDVYIVDGRKDPRIKKLLLHVPSWNFTRALTEYNSRYIYTYGPSLLSEEPIQGSVMFMGDGDKIYRLMWIPKTGRAIYPERVFQTPPPAEGRTAP